MRQPGVFKANIKREIYDCYPKRARLIQAYNDLGTQALYGEWFTQLQKAMSMAFKRTEIQPGIFVTFASGLNGWEMGKLMDKIALEVGTGNIIECDFSRFDSTVSRQWYRLAETYFQGSEPRFLRFLRRTENGIGRVFFKTTKMVYRIIGGTKSGHNQTTLANTAHCMVAHTAVCTMMQRPGQIYHILAAGDDSLVLSNMPISAQNYTELMKDTGFIPVIRAHDNLEDATFISARWVNTPNGYFFMPLLGRLLCRLGWTVRPPNSKNIENWQYSVGAGLMPHLKNCKATRSLLNYYYTRKGKTIRVEGDTYWLSQWNSTPESAAYPGVDEKLMKLYQITRPEWDDFCEKMADLGVGTYVSNTANKIMVHDLADPADRWKF